MTVMDGSDVSCILNLVSLCALVLNVFITYSECVTVIANYI